MNNNSQTENQKLFSELTEKMKNEISSKKVPHKVVLDAYLTYKKNYPKENEILIKLIKDGVNYYPNNEMNIYLSIYEDMKLKKYSIDCILKYILNRCEQRLEKLNFKKPVEEDILGLANKEEKLSNMFFNVIDKIVRNNKVLHESHDENIESVIYLYLALKIELCIKSLLLRNKLLLIMERVFVGYFIDGYYDIQQKMLGYCIPNALMSKKCQALFASYSYLYDDINKKYYQLLKNIKEKDRQIMYLRKEIEFKNEKISDEAKKVKKITAECNQLKENYDILKVEENNTKERMEYEKNNYEVKYQSKVKGLMEQYEHRLGLELDGIEDIIEYIPDKARESIQRRIERINQIINDLGEQ